MNGGQSTLTQREETFLGPREAGPRSVTTVSSCTTNLIPFFFQSSAGPAYYSQYQAVSQPFVVVSQLKLKPHFREKEIKWFEENIARRPECQGHWVVIEGEELVACEDDYSAASQKARARGIKAPFIFFVPKPSEDIFMGL